MNIGSKTHTKMSSLSSVGIPNISVHLKKNYKSKPKQNNLTSKSFSESFLKQFHTGRTLENNKNNRYQQKAKEHTSESKRSFVEFKTPGLQNDNKKKDLLLDSLDKKLLKKSTKIKSQSYNSNISFGNFRYPPYQRTRKTKSFMKTSNLKEQSDMGQIKTISSTVKNQDTKSRFIYQTLQNKSKKPNLSLSERKKTSENLQQKLNLLIADQPKIQVQKEDSVRKFQNDLKQLIAPKQIVQKKEPQKIQFKYSFRTRKGKNISNPNKVNQDSILIKQNICKRDVHMIAVADGHGPVGHHVSQFIIKNLSKYVSEQLSEALKGESEDKKDNADISALLPRIYDKIQNELTCSDINSATSGSTLVNIILQKNQILCANVGDSRAILARQMNKKNWELIYLSEDHKPEQQNQRKRILKNGGHIHSFKGQNGQSLGPLRVWLPNQNIQGLAMTRSFGDNISKQVGVIHKPQMIKVKIDQKDKFILIASDGVWEFIENQEILQLIAPFYKQNKIEEACDALLKLAYQRWTEDDDSVVDDISFVLVFFNY